MFKPTVPDSVFIFRVGVTFIFSLEGSAASKVTEMNPGTDISEAPGESSLGMPLIPNVQSELGDISTESDGISTLTPPFLFRILIDLSSSSKGSPGALTNSVVSSTVEKSSRTPELVLEESSGEAIDPKSTSIISCSLFVDVYKPKKVISLDSILSTGALALISIFLSSPPDSIIPPVRTESGVSWRYLSRGSLNSPPVIIIPVFRNDSSLCLALLYTFLNSPPVIAKLLRCLSNQEGVNRT